MSTKQEKFDVPDKDPWKDENTLYGLYHDDGLNQTEIAEHFQDQGHEVAPSTISYWMGKFEINTIQTTHDDDRDDQEERDCVNHDDCGNDVPGGRNMICNSCLDAARRKQQEEDY